MTPGETFQQVLKDNNLYVSLAPQRVRKIEDGSLIIENPQLLVDWITPADAPVASVEPAHQSTSPVEPQVAVEPQPAVEAPAETAPVEVATVEQPVTPTEGEVTNEPAATA